METRPQFKALCNTRRSPGLNRRPLVYKVVPGRFLNRMCNVLSLHPMSLAKRFNLIKMLICYNRDTEYVLCSRFLCNISLSYNKHVLCPIFLQSHWPIIQLRQSPSSIKHPKVSSDYQQYIFSIIIISSFIHLQNPTLIVSLIRLINIPESSLPTFISSNF